jgi:Holliday junction resolvase RusA-like endonuclease
VTGPSCTITLPWPDKRLSPNARLGWRGALRVKRSAKNEAVIETLRQVGGNGFRFFDGAIKATITFYPPDKRRRDRDNMVASFKAYQDGIAYATAADDSRWVPTYHVGPPEAPGRVVVALVAIGVELVE